MTYKIDGFPGREVIINNERYLYFGGTAYLGMQGHPDFYELLSRNIEKFGTSYGASRESNLQLGVYDEAEAFLAQWAGSEACLTMSSGYLAGQLTTQVLNTGAYKSFYAPNCHSALRASDAVTFASYRTLNAALRDYLSENPDKTPVVFFDTIDFSENSFPDYSGLKELPLQNTILAADDSHGIGIFGSGHLGVFKRLKELDPLELLVCASLGKALGLQAGAIFGTTKRIKTLRETDMYVGASPAAPAYLATLTQAKSLYTTQLNKLEEHIKLFRNTIQNPDHFKSIKAYPVFEFSDPDLVAFLEAHKIIITNFDYPPLAQTTAMRIVLSASHESQDIETLSQLINQYFLTKNRFA